MRMRRKDDSSSSSSASCPPGAYAREAYFAKRTEKQLWPPPTLVVRDDDDVELDKETSSSHDSTLTTTTKGGGGGPPPPPPPALDVVERPMADLLGSRRGRRRRVRRQNGVQLRLGGVPGGTRDHEEFLGDLMVEVHVVQKRKKTTTRRKTLKKVSIKTSWHTRSRRAQETKHAEKLYVPKNDVARDDSENT